MASPLIKQRSLVSQTIDLIRERISTRAWPIGHRLPAESVLAEELGVGRNTVREAVRVLSHSKVLDVRQGDGTFVRLAVDPAETIEQLNDSSFREQLELQCMLEAEAASLASQRRTEADIAELDRLLEQRGEYDTSTAFAEFMERDREFHHAIVRASHNGALLSLYEFFESTISGRLDEALKGTAYAEPGLDSHRQIVRAIDAQQPAIAAQTVRDTYVPLFEQLAAVEQGPQGNA